VARFLDPARRDAVITLRIIDISIGGCALWLPDEAPPLATGTLLDPMRCELDEETRFTAAATLQHATSATAQVGGRHGGNVLRARGVRLGCQWRSLGGLAERALQRWIDQAQRRRRLLTVA